MVYCYERSGVHTVHILDLKLLIAQRRYFSAVLAKQYCQRCLSFHSKKGFEIGGGETRDEQNDALESQLYHVSVHRAQALLSVSFPHHPPS